MDDLISRQTAIEGLKKTLLFRLNPELAERVRHYLESIPAADGWADGWIPVKERLPEEDVDVLITYRYREGEGDTSNTYIDITSYGQLYIGGNPRGHKKYWRQPFAYFASNYEVIAWMPLPEPYKEEKDD